LVTVGEDAARAAGIALIGVAALVVLANLFMRLPWRANETGSARPRGERARRT
jgi:hypothetical protein